MGFTIQIKIFCDLFIKRIKLYYFPTVVVVCIIYLIIVIKTISGIMSLIKPNFYFDGCREYL